MVPVPGRRSSISDWLLAQRVVSTVRARTLSSNAASRRVLEKASFTIVSTTGDESLYERHA
jgi:RimJ/RimL family protein N-acetyltransferase